MVDQYLIPIADKKEWQFALENLNYAFGHTWESCYAMHLTSGLPTFLYVLKSEQGKAICPITLRTLNDTTDIATPYGFSGFCASGELNINKWWQSFATSQGFICGFIGLHPILPVPSGFMEDHFEYNSVYVLNLELPIANLYQNLSQNRKRELKKAEKAPIQMLKEKRQVKEFFLQHFHHFFVQKQAAGVYNFSIATLRFLIELENTLMFGVIENGQLLAVSMFAYTNYGAEYLFNISIEHGNRYTTVLIWEAVKELKTIGIPWLNLGGGVRLNDSLSEYKQRFGPQVYPLTCLKQVYNHAVYDELCEAVNANPLKRDGYFPAYRNPGQVEKGGMP